MGNVADRIRTLRIARGLNQGQLADRIGVGRTVLGAYDLAATPAERNALLRTVLDHISYSKTQRCHRNNAPTDHLSLTLFPRVPEAYDEAFSAQNSGSMV